MTILLPIQGAYRWLRRRVARRHATSLLEERLRFETLLSETSAGLIHVPASTIDAALERGLAQVVAFLGADRGTLEEYDADEPGVRRISCVSPGIDARPGITHGGLFPWTAEKLGRGDLVRFSRLDDLPPEATTDRAAYERVGTRSHVSLPLRGNALMLGVLSFDSVQDERVWSDDLVERLRLLSEAFASALERRRVEVSLAERLAFEKLLSSLSTTFSNLSAVDFDREVQRGLRRITDLLDVDHASLVEFSKDGAVVRSWTSDDGMDMDMDDFPWMTAALRRGDVSGSFPVDQLPEDAAVDRRSCLTRGITSQVALSLLVGGRVVGGLVLSAVRAERPWKPEELMQGLHLLGEVFANALSRRQVDTEAQRLRQELTHIGRVSAMGELTASLAHELNQPLTAILNNAQVAQRFLASEAVNLEEVREILADIVADDKRAAEVIRRLRQLLRKGDLEYVPLDLNELVAEVAQLVRNDAIIRNVSMSLELAAGLPRVLGDRVQLQQVVLNLVLNGLEAMRESPARDRRLVIRTLGDGAAVAAVAVQDSGPGISEKDADRIFEPLYTTKAAGIGMGLAIARTIVDAHGGRLEAANNADGGATFQ
ncbi:MAG: GAF domain-containing protein, partial [Candidatus Rokubacteria bacterium]|nr:GAF domain-containing protein [Candidatus Rokubacteria bacterium]